MKLAGGEVQGQTRAGISRTEARRCEAEQGLRLWLRMVDYPFMRRRRLPHTANALPPSSTRVDGSGVAVMLTSST